MKKYSKTPNLLIDGYVPYSPCRACYIEDILKIVLRDSRTYVHTATFKMENQQGPAVEHRELCSVLCGSLDGRDVWRRKDTCVCMAESLRCPPETITALFVNWLYPNTK